MNVNPILEPLYTNLHHSRDATRRREFSDRILFWSKADLEAELCLYQEYFNSYRVHYSHEGKTPDEITSKRRLATIDLKSFKWKSVCGGMYQTPVAA